MNAHAGPSEAQILRHDADGIATLTLNRPAARNALSRRLMADLTAALDTVDADPSIAVVVIAATGPAFCAGHDLKEMRASPDREFYETLFTECSALMQRIVSLRQPVIARVQGIATAAGCQLVATCDLAVTAESARFATPGVNIGLFCSTPMVALTRAVGTKAAMEMLLTGDMIDSATAKAIGLVNRVVPDAELEVATTKLAQQIASKSPLVLKIGKAAFYRQIEMPLADAYKHAAAVMTDNMMAMDAAEGIDAFIGKRQPSWKNC